MVTRLEPDQQAAAEHHVVLPAGVNLPIVIWQTGIEIAHLKTKPDRYPQQADNTACIDSGAKLQCAVVGSRSERCAATGRFFKEARVTPPERQPGSDRPGGMELEPQMRGKKHV